MAEIKEIEKANKILKQNVERKKQDCIKMDDIYNDVQILSKAFNILLAENKQYKDKLADGRMVELPCKVGSDLYQIVDSENIKRYPSFVMGFLIVDNKIQVYTKESYCVELGKDMYLTLTEAEQALKETEANNG